jgi:streptogramin lyase
VNFVKRPVPACRNPFVRALPASNAAVGFEFSELAGLKYRRPPPLNLEMLSRNGNPRQTGVQAGRGGVLRPARYNAPVSQINPLRKSPSFMMSRAFRAIAATLFLSAGAANGQFNNLTMSAASALYAIPNAGNYDSANIYLAPDGSIWAASALENVILKLSPDGLQSTRWTLPTGTGPSFLIPNPDGTFWVTELGNTNFGKFDPATGDFTEWADFTRRQTAWVRRPDGKFWVPETSGLLALFDPETGTTAYSQSSSIFSLSYPYLDFDGTIWSCDFIGGYLVHFTADGTSARRWLLPSGMISPSKIIRGFDGALWISVYTSGQLARYDPATSEMKVYTLTSGTLPYDLLNYKDRLIYSDQAYGVIGFFDPNGSIPSITQTLTPETTDLTLSVITKTSLPKTTNIVPTTDAITVPPPTISTGNFGAGLAEYAVGITSIWGVTVDSAKNRIVFGTKGYIGTLFPPIPASKDDLYFPSAASIGGAGARWKTQVVTWNKGTPSSTGATSALAVAEQLIPNGWIAGYLPNATNSIGAGQLLAQDDPIGHEMLGPDSFGALRLEASSGTTADLFGWARVYTERADGGTYGLAMNPSKPAGAVGAGDTGYLFTPPDTTHRTNAGFTTVDASEGTVSIVDANGTTLASRAFKWPGGTHTQYSPLFSSFGIDPVPSARFVVTVTSGTVLPFGTSTDPLTHDPIGLELAKASEAVLLQGVPAVFRDAGPLGPGSRTDLQLYTPGSVSATVQIVFRSATPGGPLPSTQVTVPAGKVVSLADPLGSLLGLTTAIGTLDIVSDQPVSVFARVYGSDPSGGTFGYGLTGKISALAVSGGSRGVFLADTDSGYDVIQSDLLLANISDIATTVTLNLTGPDGNPAGTHDYALAPKEVRYVATPWFSIAGYGTTMGRLDVLPSGTAAVFATLLRQDRKTGDTDAILPALTTK